MIHLIQWNDWIRPLVNQWKVTTFDESVCIHLLSRLRPNSALIMLVFNVSIHRSVRVRWNLIALMTSAVRVNPPMSDMVTSNGHHWPIYEFEFIFFQCLKFGNELDLRDLLTFIDWSDLFTSLICICLIFGIDFWLAAGWTDAIGHSRKTLVVVTGFISSVSINQWSWISAAISIFLHIKI